MDCPFCASEMKSVNPGLALVWVCHSCPREVRVKYQQDAEQQWCTQTLIIFVSHNQKKYGLLWDYATHLFSVLDIATPSGSGYIVQTEELPEGITPDNALDKLLTLLIFS